MTNDHLIERLKQIMNDYSSSHYGVVLSSRKNTDLKEWLISNTPSDCNSLTERMIIILDGNNPHICENGNRMIYSLGKFRYCKKDCECQIRDRKISHEKSKKTRIEKYGSYWSNDMSEKSKRTNLEKFGVEHHLKSEDGKEKFKKIIQEKYGEDIVSTLQLNETKEKIKKTNLEKYGVEYGLQSNKVREKITKSRIERHGSYWSDDMYEKSKKTYLDKFGVEHHLKSAEGKEKFKKIIKEKYGEDIVSTLQLDETKEKIKQTNLEKYGVKSPMQNNDIKEKIKQTNSEKYGVEFHTQKHIEPKKLAEFHDDEKFIELYNSFNYVSDIMEYFGIISESTVHQRAKKLNLPTKYNLVSKEEQELADFLSQYTRVEQSRRDIIKPKEIDIFLPEFNLGIEYNGIYYHSTKFSKITPDYHIEKTKRMNNLGYSLIHIFSDEWNNKPDIVKSVLLDALGKNDIKIYSQQTNIHEVSANQSDDFLQKNHVKGKYFSDIRYGLFYGNELVSLMTFSRSISNKNYEWEMVRFCNKLNTEVVDGASKLLKHFVKNYGNSIISYSDKRWHNDGFHDILGFQKIGDTKPECYMINKNNRYIISDTMETIEFDRVYDCGNSIWVLL